MLVFCVQNEGVLCWDWIIRGHFVLGIGDVGGLCLEWMMRVFCVVKG